MLLLYGLFVDVLNKILRSAGDKDESLLVYAILKSRSKLWNWIFQYEKGKSGFKSQNLKYRIFP